MSLPRDDQPGEPGRVPFISFDPRNLPRKRITEPLDLAELTSDRPWDTFGQRVYEVAPDKRPRRLDV